MARTITRQELLELWNGLPALAGLKGFKLGYAVARTKEKLKSEVAALVEAQSPTPRFLEFEEKRLGLCRKFAQKDSLGNPIVTDKEFVFEDRGEFDAAMTVLAAEYAEAVEDRKQQIADYDAVMKETITVEIHQVAEADVPADVTVGQMATIYLILERENVL